MLQALPRWVHAADPCASMAREQCYGEVLNHGLQRMLQMLPSPCILRPDDVIYDVGSGFGAAAAYMSDAVNVSQVVGVEVNACRAATAASRHGANATSRLLLRLGDVRKLGFDRATMIYMTSQCFAPSLLRSIFGRLAVRAAKLRCIVDVGSLDSLASQRIVSLAAPWGMVRRIAQDITATWDEHAAAIYFVRGACSASCVRRAHRWLKHAAEDLEAADLPGPVNPWALASRHASVLDLPPA